MKTFNGSEVFLQVMKITRTRSPIAEFATGLLRGRQLKWRDARMIHDSKKRTHIVAILFV